MATTLTERFRFVSPVETEHPFHVTNFTGVEGLHRLFDFHIDLVCADAAVDTGKLLAAPCRFEILRDGDAAPAIFSGYPARVEQRGFFNGYAYYSVHLRPTLWKLTRIRQSAIFLGKKLEDVLRELINSQTFFQFPHEFRLTAGDYPAPEFAMQYQETLYDYLCWRMEEQGAYFYFEEKDGADKVIFADAPQSHEAGGAPTLFYAPASGLEGDRREEVIVSFSLAQTPLPRRVALRSYDWRNPNKPVVGMADVDANGLGDVYLSNEYVDNDADAARLATIRAQELRCRGRLFHGASSAPTLRPGRIFRLDRHYSPAFNRDYLVTEITHEGRQDAYLSLGLGIPLRDADERLYYRNTFTCMEADVPYRPARTAPRNHISGVLRAFVAGDGSGARAETDEYGRYKLTFPFDLSGRTGGNASCWIRRAQPQVGKDSGLSLPLLPGTEVLVSFVDGNPDLPVIAGALANGETGSISNAGNANIQGLRTPGGNQLTINDTDNKQGIALTTATGCGLTVAAGSTESALLHAAHITQAAGAASTQLASFGLSQLSGFKVSSGAFRFDKDAYWPAFCATLFDSAGAVTNSLSSHITDNTATKNALDWGTASAKVLSTALNTLGDLIVGLHTAPIPYGGAMVAEDSMAKTLLQVSASAGDMVSAVLPYFLGRLPSVASDSIAVGTEVEAAKAGATEQAQKKDKARNDYTAALEQAMEELYKYDNITYGKYKEKDGYLTDPCASFEEVNFDLLHVGTATLKELRDKLKQAKSDYCDHNWNDDAYYAQQKNESERTYLVNTLSSLLPEILSLYLFKRGYNPSKKLGGILLSAQDRNITMTAQDAIAMHAQRGFLRNTRDLPEIANSSGDTKAALGELQRFADGEKADKLKVLKPYISKGTPQREGMDAAAYWGVKINDGAHATDFMGKDIDGLQWNIKDHTINGSELRKKATFIADTTELEYRRNRWSYQHSEEDAVILGDKELTLQGGEGFILMAKETEELPALTLTTTKENTRLHLISQVVNTDKPCTEAVFEPSRLRLGYKKKQQKTEEYNASLSLSENEIEMLTGETILVLDKNSAWLGHKNAGIICVPDEVCIDSDKVTISNVQIANGKIVGTQGGILEIGGAIKIMGANATISDTNLNQQYKETADSLQEAAERTQNLVKKLEERIAKLEKSQETQSDASQ